MGYAKNNYDENTMARARAIDVGVSTKTSIEVCNFIRNKPTKKAKSLLEKVLKKEIAVPFRRFNWDVGHKPGQIGPGRYPEKATEAVLKLIKQAESNAINKGLSQDNLVITHLVVQKASGQWRMGRQGRRKAKTSHLEIMVTDMEPKSKKEKPKAAPAKAPKEEQKDAKKETTDKSSEVSDKKVQK